MSDSESAKKSGMPLWATEPFHEFLRHQEDLARILHLSTTGIAMLRGRHGALEALRSVKDIFPEDDFKKIDDKALEHAARERDLAQSEVDNDFPILHEQATVALWGSLEALVRSFAASWLANKAGAWQVDAVKKLRIRLGDYEALEPLDRCLWVIDLIDQETSGPLRNGVSRFENLLQVFQLDGATDEECRKTLFEMSQVRHAIVHRRGRADRKLIEACPWLSLKPGDRVKITHKMWHRYHEAVAEYVLELIQRVRVAFGCGRYESTTDEARVEHHDSGSKEPIKK
jgi:hypothetical protein